MATSPLLPAPSDTPLVGLGLGNINLAPAPAPTTNAGFPLGNQPFAPYVQTPTVPSSSVVTSNPAQKDLNTIQTNTAATEASIAAQKQKTDAANALKAQQDAAAAQQKIDNENAAKALKLKENAVGGDKPATRQIITPDGVILTVDNSNNEIVGSYDQTTGKNNASLYSQYLGGDVSQLLKANSGIKDPNNPNPSSAFSQTDTNNTEAGALSAEQLQQARESQQKILDYQNGVVPLTAAEQAQVDAMQQSFKLLIDQQTKTNQLQEGYSRVTAAQRGQEYTPEIQGGIIKNVIDNGTAKIADLNTKMTTSLAALKQGFIDHDIQAVRDANSAFQDAARDRQSFLSEQNKTIAAAAQDLRDYNQKIQDTKDKAVADVQKSIDEVKTNAVKGGAPKSVLDALAKATTLDEALAAGGDYLNSLTGAPGEYLFYKRDAEANGLTPLTFDEYQTRDANRKAKLAAAANAAGLTTALTNTALKLSDDYEARSKDFYTVRDNYNRLLASANDPSAAGDLALIFSYMKTLDPTSTVRESEFATAANSGSAWNQVGAQYNKILNGERLTTAQRADFVKKAGSLFNASKAQQDQTAAEFTERAGQYGVPANLVVRGTDATSLGQDLVQEESAAKEKVHQYVTANKDKAEEVAKLSETPSAAFGGKVPTYAQIAEYYNL